MLVFILLILQRVAFYTLIERHTLGLTQNRFGPKKTRVWGLLQPLLDGVKLIGKEQLIILNVSPTIFLGMTLLTFCLGFREWLLLPYWFSFNTIYWRYLFILFLLGVNVYTILYGGLYSKRKYSYLGSIRTSVSRVSYEVIFSLNILVFILYNKSFTLRGIFNWGLFLLFLTFFIRVLVETRRAPFDYSESESELVSGFNTEYSRVGFVLFFLKEYISLLFFRVVISILFSNGGFILTVLIFSLIVMVRRSFPRVRFDILIKLFWLQLIFHVCAYLWATYIFLIL